MAPVARCISPMQLQLLTNGRCTAGVGFDRRDTFGRWRALDSEDSLVDPCSTHNWRCSRAIGCHLQYARLRQHSAARGTDREIHAPHCTPFHRRELVVHGKSFIDERKIRIDNVSSRQILVNQLSKVHLRFGQSGID